MRHTMRPLTAGILSIALLALSGCPQPEDPLAADATQTAGAAPSGAAAPPPQSADGTPGAAAPSDGTAPPAPGQPFTPVGFASLIVDGKSVTITGKLTGAQAAQVDFTAIKEVEGSATPEVIEIVKVTDGTFKVTAPATYDREIYITAIATTGDKGPSPSDPGGAAKAPIKLEGKDVTVEVALTTDPDWMKALPWYREGAPLPPEGGALEGGGAGDAAAVPPPPAAAAGAPGGPPAPQGSTATPAAAPTTAPPQ